MTTLFRIPDRERAPRPTPAELSPPCVSCGKGAPVRQGWHARAATPEEHTLLANLQAARGDAQLALQNCDDRYDGREFKRLRNIVKRYRRTIADRFVLPGHYVGTSSISTIDHRVAPHGKASVLLYKERRWHARPHRYAGGAACTLRCCADFVERMVIDEDHNHAAHAGGSARAVEAMRRWYRDEEA